MKPAARWLLDFALFFAALYVPALLFVERAHISEGVAQLQAAVLGFLGLEASAAHSYVFLGGAAFKVVPECSGIVLLALIAALLLATMPRPRALRLLLPAALALLVYNFARLSVAIIASSAWAPAHEALWLLDGAAVLAVWRACWPRRRKPQ